MMIICLLQVAYWGTLLVTEAAPEGAPPVKPSRGEALAGTPDRAGETAPPVAPPSSEPAPRSDDEDGDATREGIRRLGGEAEGVVEVANLVYAGTKSSQCFSDHFLVKAEKESTISTSRRFHAVKLDSGEVFDFPLVIMTGEGDFQFSAGERKRLREFVRRGGLLLASAGCSSEEWDRAFRREMELSFSDVSLESIGLDHPLFAMVYDVTELRAKHGDPRPLEGMTFDGRLGVVYSRDGLNDTEHAQGCCCCGGNELTNADEINVNVLAYSLLY